MDVKLLRPIEHLLSKDQVSNNHPTFLLSILDGMIDEAKDCDVALLVVGDPCKKY